MGSTDIAPVESPAAAYEAPSRERLRFLISLTLAGTLGWVWWSVSPDQLSGHINIVGYPIYSDFAFERSFLAYRLIVWELPIVSALVYALLRRHGPLRILTPNREGTIAMINPAVAGQISAESAHPLTRGILQLAPPAILVAITVSAGQLTTRTHVTGVGLLAGVAYIAALLILSALAARLPRGHGRGRHFPARPDEVLSLLNAFATVVVSVSALLSISAHTLVITKGSERRYWPWFPGWFAAVILLAAFTWIIWRLAAGWLPSLVERRVRVTLLGSVAIFLLTATVPGGIRWFSGFDDAQSVVGADLLTRGYFPWRDFLFIHGLFDDALRSSIGFGVFEHSLWGALAGTALIVVPLCWVGYYLLSVWAGHSRSLILLGIFAAAAWGGFPGLPRFVAVPLIFILLGEALRRPNPLWTSLFTVAMFTEAVLVPETSLQVIAAAITITACEVVHHDPERSWWFTLRRTRYFIATGAGLSVLLAAVLALNHSLSPFFSYYAIFGPGHNAAGAIPPSGITQTAAALFFTSIMLVALTTWSVAGRLFGRHPWSTQDWITVSAAILTGLYGEKALGRFDGAHVAQALAVALPLWIMWGARAVGHADDIRRTALSRSHARERRRQNPWLDPGPRERLHHPVTILALVLTIALTPSVAQAFWKVPGNTKRAVGSAASTPLVGYEHPGAVNPRLLADLGRVVSTYAGRYGEIFDNTNSLGYFYYLLQRSPASTFVHVSAAEPKFAQQLLIDQLTRSRPSLVAFDDDTIGLPSWDGPRNNVRHFKVAQYLLDGWAPILRTHSVLFLLRKDLVANMPKVPRLTSPPRTSGLELSGPTCDWGYAANFLDSQPAGPTLTLPVTSLVDRSRLEVRGWSFDTKAHATPSRIVITVAGSVIAQVAPSLGRADVAAHLGDPAAEISGFEVSVLMPRQGNTGVYALGIDGTLHPVGATARPPTGYVQMPDGTRLTVTTRALGSVDRSRWSIPRLLSVSIPRSTHLTSFRLATFTAPSTIGASWLDLTDEPIRSDDRPGAAGRQVLNSSHAITAKVLPGSGSSLAVRVGSCLQWRGYQSTTLYLLQTGGVPITELRLSGVRD